jgi:hypothetical protein
MAWFKKQKTTEPELPKRSKISEGMWLKCNHCREIVYRKEVDRNNKVCPKCDYHFPISVMERITLLVDLGTFKEWDAEIGPRDPLNFQDTKSYKDRVKAHQGKTGRKDAMMIGEGMMNGRRVVLCVFDFSFMGGSINDRFEGRARLSPGMDSPVELTLAEITSSYHGLYITGLRVKAEQGALNKGFLLQCEEEGLILSYQFFYSHMDDISGFEEVSRGLHLGGFEVRGCLNMEGPGHFRIGENPPSFLHPDRVKLF